MQTGERPIVIGFDGSEEAQAAVRAAAELFGDRPVVIVSVWEPGLAMIGPSYPDALGVTLPSVTPEEIATVDEIQRDHAEGSAEAGAALARGLGLTAEARAMPDGSNPAETIAAVADERDAAAIVVGSRGLGAVRSRLLGSTSRKLLGNSKRPVVVVRPPV